MGCYQLAITIGLLLAAIVNNSTGKRNDTGSYRIPIAIQFAWAIILITGMLILPETPRFCIKQGKNEKAAKALSRLRRLDVDHPALVEELGEIHANHEYELSIGKASYIDCFKGNLGFRLLTGCLLQSLQQLTGVSARSLSFLLYLSMETDYDARSTSSSTTELHSSPPRAFSTPSEIPSSATLSTFFQHSPACTWWRNGVDETFCSSAPSACSAPNTSWELSVQLNPVITQPTSPPYHSFAATSFSLLPAGDRLHGLSLARSSRSRPAPSACR